MTKSTSSRRLLAVSLLVVLQLFLAASLSAGAPLRVHPTNPRYFTDDSGKAVYLTGSHSWTSFHDITFQEGGPSRHAFNEMPGGNFTGYLDWLVSYNHNFIRMWTADIPKDDYYLLFIAPVPYARPGPGVSQDGSPKFDLAQYDQAYFERLHDLAADAQSRGIYVSVMLFTSQSVFDPKTWKYNPYNRNNNINGIDCNPNDLGNDNGWGCHTLTYPDVIQRQEDYVRHVIDTLNDLDNILYEICNEDFGGDFNWQYYFIDYVHNYESSKPKQHPVIITSKGAGFSNIWLANSKAESISPGIGTLDESAANPYASNPPAADGFKVQILDTDHIGFNIFINDAVFTRTWVWKSFTRGYNPILMEDFSAASGWEAGRAAMGYARVYADRMNLAAMMPRGDLTSTGFALVNPGLEYLVYQPVSESFTVQVSAGDYNYEWFDPTTGSVALTGSLNGGGDLSFTPPFSGDAVLYLKFAGTTSTITATAGDGGTIDPFGAVTVTQGASQTFTITPNAGYVIEDVTVDGVSVGAVSTYTFDNVAGDHSIRASFSIDTVIPKLNWRLNYVDSQELVYQNNAAVNAFDGDSATMWVTEWFHSYPPHEIQINLGGSYDISGFRYLPMQLTGNENGRIKDYEFYVSADGVNWGTAVATGTFANTTLEKEVLFAPKTGQYIQLRALTEVNGNPWTSMAEISVLGSPSSDN